VSTQDTETLPELVEALLTHDFKAEIVKTQDGGYGIALMLDGWYTSRHNDFALDAESVLPYWQDIVDRIRALAAEERR
jgi:hypothetical protein